MGWLEDIGNFISNPAKEVNTGLKGVGANRLEQLISGGRGWPGLGQRAGMLATGNLPALALDVVTSEGTRNALAPEASAPTPAQQPQDNKDIATLSNMYAKYQQGEAAKNISDANKQAYASYLDRAQGTQAAGEQGFLKETGQAPEELKALQESMLDVNSRQNQDYAKQIALNQATRGVRGGQAAVGANRAMGDYMKQGTQDYNKIAYDEAQKRRDQRAQYFGNKSSQGNQGALGLGPRYISMGS